MINISIGDFQFIFFYYLLYYIFMIFRYGLLHNYHVSVLYRDGLIAVEEACEAISVYVDDLWKLGEPAYTEERMKSFLDMIGNEIVELTQHYIDTVH